MKCCRSSIHVSLSLLALAAQSSAAASSSVTIRSEDGETSTSSSTSSTTARLRRRTGSSTTNIANLNPRDVVECTLYMAEGIMEMSDKKAVDEIDIIRCVDDVSYSFSLVIENYPIDDTTAEAIYDGNVKLRIPSMQVQGGSVIQFDSSTIQVVNSRRVLNRRNKNSAFEERRHGVKSVLAIRVSSNYEVQFGGKITTPNTSAQQLVDVLFKKKNCLRNQYMRCSRNKLIFNPAEGVNITDGVMELVIPQNMGRMAYYHAEFRSMQKLVELGFDMTKYDQLVFLFPSIVDFKGMGGLAYINFPISIFKDIQIKDPFTLAHELGHNLYLQHSGNGTDKYADHNGLMGSPLTRFTSNLCFNGPKSFYLGWYTGYQRAVIPTLWSLDAQLFSIPDYFHDLFSQDQLLVVRIKGDDKDESDLFVMFHEKAGITDGVEADMALAVTQQKSDLQDSTLLTTIGSGGVFRRFNWSKTGNDLIVKFCGIEHEFENNIFGKTNKKYAHVQIFLDDGGKSNLSCAPPPNPQDHACVDSEKYVHDVNYVGGSVVMRTCTWLAYIAERHEDRARDICFRRFNPADHSCCQTCSMLNAGP